MSLPLTTWHITFGTYGSRLHGGDRPTVHRRANQPGDPFVAANSSFHTHQRASMTAAPVFLDSHHRQLIEQLIPQLCARGGWSFRCAAAQPDHVHVLLDAPADVHGRQLRPLLKRWLSQALSEQSPAPRCWWAKGGSTIALHDPTHLASTTRYILRQQFTPLS